MEKNYLLKNILKKQLWNTYHDNSVLKNFVVFKKNQYLLKKHELYFTLVYQAFEYI